VGVERNLGGDDSLPIPYAVVTVDLDVDASVGAPLGPVPATQAEIPLACRVFGRLVPHDAAAIGLAVEPVFEDHDGWTELLFAPRNPQPTTETRTP
jgi:hypothetical protein